MLSFNGWLDGITSSGVVIFGIILGIFFIYQSKKKDVKLLFQLGIITMLAGLMFLGVFLDFVIVVLTGANLDNKYGIVGLLSYIWFAPLTVLGMYLGSELQTPEKTKYIVSLFLVIAIIFEVVIFIEPMGSFNFDPVPPKTPGGENLIDYNINFLSLAGILMACLLLPILFFLGIGFLIQAFKLSGELRKKFFYLSLGVFCYCVFGIFEGLTVPGAALIFVRFGYLSSFWFMYLGL